MTRRALVIIVCVVIGSSIAFWVRTDSTTKGVTLRTENRRLWGYFGRPGNPVSAWCAEKLKAYDRRRGNLGESMLTFDGASMCWGYSNPTSAWFAFGNMVGRSNLAYFEFALPTIQNVAVAVENLPALEFHGADSNYWAMQVGTNNLGFTSNTVGRGAIRLSTGSVLFVRHTDHPETVHLLSLESMREGIWGDVKVQFQRGIMPSHRATRRE